MTEQTTAPVTSEAPVANNPPVANEVPVSKETPVVKEAQTPAAEENPKTKSLFEVPEDTDQGGEKSVEAEESVETEEPVELTLEMYKTQWDEQGEVPPLVEGFKNFALENKISPEVATKLADWYYSQEQEMVAQVQNDRVEAQRNNIKKLTEQYGHDRLRDIESEAVNAALDLGGEEFVHALREAGVGANPAVVKALLNASKSVTNGVGEGNTLLPPTAPSLEEQEAAIRADTDYFNPLSPRFKELQDKIRALTIQRLSK